MSMFPINSWWKVREARRKEARDWDKLQLQSLTNQVFTLRRALYDWESWYWSDSWAHGTWGDSDGNTGLEAFLVEMKPAPRAAIAPVASPEEAWNNTGAGVAVQPATTESYVESASAQPECQQQQRALIAPSTPQERQARRRYRSVTPMAEKCRSKRTRFSTAPPPGFDPSVNTHSDELEKCRLQIGELQKQAAAHSAIEARRAELQEIGRLRLCRTLTTSLTEYSYNIKDVFTQFADGATAVDISEPYLISSWQLKNLDIFLQSLVDHTSVRTVRLCTHSRCKCSEEGLVALLHKFGRAGLDFQYTFASELHVREINYSNGIIVSSDRGLDIYRAPVNGIRRCREGRIFYFEKLPDMSPVAPQVEDVHQSRVKRSPSKHRRSSSRDHSPLEWNGGVIKSVFADRRFGFLASDGSRSDVYFSFDSVERGVAEVRSKVEFVLGTDAQGRPRALRVRVNPHDISQREVTLPPSEFPKTCDAITASSCSAQQNQRIYPEPKACPSCNWEEDLSLGGSCRCGRAICHSCSEKGLCCFECRAKSTLGSCALGGENHGLASSSSIPLEPVHGRVAEGGFVDCLESANSHNPEAVNEESFVSSIDYSTLRRVLDTTMDEMIELQDEYPVCSECLDASACFLGREPDDDDPLDMASVPGCRLEGLADLVRSWADSHLPLSVRPRLSVFRFGITALAADLTGLNAT